MQKLTLAAMALFLASSTTLSHAEMMQAPALSTSAASSNLASELLNRDKSSSSSLFSANIAATPAIAAIPAASSKSLSTALANTAAISAADTTATISVPVREMLSSKVVTKSESSDDSDIMDRMSMLASQTVRKLNQSGLASWYGRQFNGRKTASGERFDMNAMTAAHRSLPLACYIRVTNQDNGKSVVVKVNDRGPFHGKRILDLSYAAAQKIGITQRGTGNVTIERIEDPSSN
jgi:rare lipoprotein A